MEHESIASNQESDMKFLATMFTVAAVATLGYAQCSAPSQAPSPAQVRQVPTSQPTQTVRLSPAIDRSGKQSELTAEAKEFARTGPTLFTDMDAAIKVSEQTGKPVVCWVSQDSNRLAIFNNAEARKISKELGETTIQVAMGVNPTRDRTDRDGKPLGARVEFSDTNYVKDARTAYIPVSKLKDDSGEKILAFARGGK